MSLVPTGGPDEAILNATLVTPRDRERANRLVSTRKPRPKLPVKKPQHVFFDPENQPRGLVGQVPEGVALAPAPKKPVLSAASWGMSFTAFGRFGFAISDCPGGRYLGATPFGPHAYSILYAICESYRMTPVQLMDGRGDLCRWAREEAYYTLLTACGLTAVEVSRIMRRRSRTVLDGAHRHADVYELPVLWPRRGPRRGAGKGGAT